MIISEGVIIALLVSLLLLGLALKMRSLPVVFISSLGWLISGLQIYDQTQEFLPLALLFMVAVSQFMLITDKS